MKIITVFFLSVLVFGVVNGQAEIITLKSGKVIEGKILEIAEQHIKVDVGGSPLYFEKKLLKSIDESVKLPAIDYLRDGLRLVSEKRFAEAEILFQKGLKSNPADLNLMEAAKIMEGLRNKTLSEEYAVLLCRGLLAQASTCWAKQIRQG